MDSDTTPIRRFTTNPHFYVHGALLNASWLLVSVKDEGGANRRGDAEFSVEGCTVEGARAAGALGSRHTPQSDVNYVNE